MELDRLHGVVWRRVWQSGAVTVRLGETTDRRWIAWHSGRGLPYAYWDERNACEQVDRWVARGVWRELAATSKHEQHS